jgi:hypothetical protein
MFHSISAAFRFLLPWCATLLPLTAWAVDKPALEANGTVGYFTYKSKYAVSNDTGIRYDYAAALYAGDSRNVGMVMRGNMQSAEFELVSKQLDSSALDFLVQLHLGPVYFGPMFGMANYKFTDTGTVTFDLNERHYGANIGFQSDIIRNGTLKLDVLITNQYDAKEVNDQKIELGMRMEGDLRVDMKISRSFGAIVGGKYMMYTLQSQAEAITMPYAGIKVNLEF